MLNGCWGRARQHRRKEAETRAKIGGSVKRHFLNVWAYIQYIPKNEHQKLAVRLWQVETKPGRCFRLITDFILWLLIYGLLIYLQTWMDYTVGPLLKLCPHKMHFYFKSNFLSHNMGDFSPNFTAPYSHFTKLQLLLIRHTKTHKTILMENCMTVLSCGQAKCGESDINIILIWDPS